MENDFVEKAPSRAIIAEHIKFQIDTLNPLYCGLNELLHTIYWNILISILGMSGYMM